LWAQKKTEGLNKNIMSLLPRIFRPEKIKQINPASLWPHHEFIAADFSSRKNKANQSCIALAQNNKQAIVHCCAFSG